MRSMCVIPCFSAPNMCLTGKLSFSSSEIVIKRYSTPFGALRCLFDPLLVTPSISSMSGVALDGGGSSTCFRIFVGWTFGTL